MKVKLLVSRAGVGFSQTAGDVVEVEEKEAKSLIKANQAEPVAAVERATAKKPVKKAVKQ